MNVYFHAIGGGKNPDHVKLLNNTFSVPVDGYYPVLFRADAGEVLDDYLVQGNKLAGTAFIENASGSTVSSFRACNNSGGSFKLQSATSGFSTSC
jgi:hypothetical protein